MKQIETLRAQTLADNTLSFSERKRRESILDDIATRLQDKGEHSARSHPDRARQFMPFAALKGYHELAYDRERTREPKHVMTEERAVALSQTIAKLSKGTMVSIVHYDTDHYTTTCGMVTEIDEAFHRIRITKNDIAFQNIYSIEITG